MVKTQKRNIDNKIKRLTKKKSRKNKTVKNLNIKGGSKNNDYDSYGYPRDISYLYETDEYDEYDEDMYINNKKNKKTKCAKYVSIVIIISGIFAIGMSSINNF